MITNEKGSLTIETAMIFTLVLFSVSLLLFAFMLMYNKVVLTSLAIDLAESIGEVLLKEEDINSSFNVRGQKIFEEETEGLDGLKARLNELGNGLEVANDKHSNTFKEIKMGLYENIKKRLIILQKITIIVEANKELTGVEVRAVLTMEVRGFNGFELIGSGMATKIKPTGYIRNIDLSLEYLRKMKEGVN